MWPTLTFLAIAAAVYLHWRWRRRYQSVLREAEQQRRDNQRLRDLHELASERAEVERQALFNSMVEGFLIVDREGRVQAVNQALRDIFSLEGDVRGRPIIEVFRQHQLVEIWQQAQSEGQVRGYELDLPGTENRCLEISASALRGRIGVPEGGVFIFHDLTRIKQLENTRREFVANVSHELRTPLTLIKGFVETLIDGAKDDPEVALRFLQMIDKHTDRLTFLIEDLLTISKLESGQIILNLQTLSLGPLVGSAFEDLQSRASERDIRLRSDVPDNLRALIDSDRLQQVLFNLIDNAIKYGRSGGEVLVTGRAGEDRKVEICVRDDGPGIPQESVERVFERFYRVDKARSREQGGTGLGLAIVKHIVQSHKGEVWVESKQGEGSSFYFTLPAA